MHELSIAQSILDIVRDNLAQHDPRAVRSVRVRVGECSGVVPDSLEFCYAALVHATPLAGSHLLIEVVPFTVHCPSCGNDFKTEYGIVLCPACGGSATRVVSGTELQVVEFALAEEMTEAS